MFALVEDEQVMWDLYFEERGGDEGEENPVTDNGYTVGDPNLVEPDTMYVGIKTIDDLEGELERGRAGE